MILLNMLTLLLAVHSSVHGNSREDRIQSHLDVVEINDYKYNIGIDKAVKLDSRFSAPEDLAGDKEVTLMRMKNVHGQSYECCLPKFKDLPNDSDGNSEGEMDKEKDSYNFTLINEKVKKSVEGLAKSNLCIFRSLGWWTYEFCFGSHVSQYHLMNNGSIEGEIINLGNFTSDYNWLMANESNFPISSGILFHEQYYELGTICELTGSPRRVIAKIFCDDQQTTEIDLISEVETCIYEIHINSNSLCYIPYFSKKQNKFDIRCSPVVDQTTYADYLAKKKQAEIEKQNRQEALKNQVKETSGILDKTTVPEAEAIIPKTEPTTYIETNSQKLAKPEISVNIESTEIETDVNEKQLNKFVPKEDVNLASQILKKLNLGMDDLQNFNTQLLNQNKELYKQLKEKGDNPEEEEKIGDWLNQIEKSLDTIGSELNKQKVTETEEGQSTELEPRGNEEAVTSEKDDLSSSKLIKELGSLADLSEVDLNAEIEKLSNSLGLSEENRGQKIQIKMIKLDSDGKNLDSDDLNSLLNSMLKENDDIKEFERLTDSYNYVYDSNADLELAEDQEEASQTEMNDFLLKKSERTFITSDNVNVELWEKNAQKREKEDDESENLIMY